MSVFVGWCYFMSHGYLPARTFWLLCQRGELPCGFARPAGWGDIVIAVLAVAVVGAMRTEFAKTTFAYLEHDLDSSTSFLLSSARSGLA